MKPEQIVEATLFASQTPLTEAELARADGALDSETVRAALATLREQYEEQQRAFQLYQIGGGHQILTRPEFAPYLERFDSIPRSPTLSVAALETLAIVAYRQPIGRVEIEEVRGVSCSSVLRTLQEWELIAVVGRGEGLGRPLLYGTTRRFLDHFGLESLEALPEPEELPVTLQTEPIEATLGADSDGGAHSDAGADAAVEATRREGVVLDVDAEGVQTNGAGG
jgi:segregation and condensation protein B